MFELYLIRHGKTLANEKKLYCGFSDLPLSKSGRKEIKKIKHIYPECNAYFTSGMLRCNETLEIIQGKKVNFTALPLLKEINVGRFELKSYEELKNNREYIQWICDKTGNTACPGGESKNMFSGRVSMGFLSLTDKMIKESQKSGEAQADSADCSCEKFMCVVHGGVIVVVMEILFGKTKTFYQWQPEPGFGYKLIHDGFSGYSGYEKIGV